jgi:hypothetical protein
MSYDDTAERASPRTIKNKYDDTTGRVNNMSYDDTTGREQLKTNNTAGHRMTRPIVPTPWTINKKRMTWPIVPPLCSRVRTDLC